ncbi:hypothetical protein POTOM_022034 [Populus tomentosa]|uniref:Uncharacterized protein n=1 Tax=Populus tomentosa TaxID=118781 RepID=A0A8X7ZUW2_POPTO|nr:hypothetical protein POTOM_022034 [Populus tomentosa]
MYGFIAKTCPRRLTVGFSLPSDLNRVIFNSLRCAQLVESKTDQDVKLSVKFKDSVSKNDDPVEQIQRIGPVGDEHFDQSFMQPSLEKFPQEELHQTTMEESMGTTLVSNGCVDIRGRIADKRTTGGWKAAPFIIAYACSLFFDLTSWPLEADIFFLSVFPVNEVAERLAFYAIAVNMVAYLVFQMHQSLPDAATHVTDRIQDHRYFLLHLYSGNGIIDALSFYRQLTSTTMQGKAMSTSNRWPDMVLVWCTGPYSPRFLDKAAVVTDPEADTRNRWRLCTVTQVEEFKSFIRILPVWASTIALSISFAQLSTFFISQANIMDRKLGYNFIIPAGHSRGITSLQRIGVGLFISIFAVASAALVEKKRRHSPNPSDMSVFWLFLQFFLIGSAEVFSYVGQLEFFYDEATDGTRSISSAMFLSEIGIGSWLSTAIVKIIERATGGEEKGWLRNNLNLSKLDYFYWVLTSINAVNLAVYVWIAVLYKGMDGAVGSVRSESVFEMGDGVFAGKRR